MYFEATAFACLELQGQGLVAELVGLYLRHRSRAYVAPRCRSAACPSAYQLAQTQSFDLPMGQKSTARVKWGCRAVLNTESTHTSQML